MIITLPPVTTPSAYDPRLEVSRAWRALEVGSGKSFCSSIPPLLPLPLSYAHKDGSRHATLMCYLRGLEESRSLLVGSILLGG
eukprot:763940-Hanusia_phi.AAC.8